MSIPLKLISNGLFSNFLFLMSRGLACCINPQPGGPCDFWSRFSSSSPWYASIKLQGSSASFGPPREYLFPRYPPCLVSVPVSATRGGGEAPDGRLATPHGSQRICWDLQCDLHTLSAIHTYPHFVDITVSKLSTFFYVFLHRALWGSYATQTNEMRKFRN